MKKTRVLLLVHAQLVPPDQATPQELAKAPAWRTEYDVFATLKKLGFETEIAAVQDNLGVLRSALFDFKPDVVFNLLEEFHGEAIFDQNIVSYLELQKFHYTGCNPRGLVLGRDKALCKKILHYHRIATPRFAVAPVKQKPRSFSDLKFPLFVKSLVEEASLGITQASIVYDNNELKERIQYFHRQFNTDVIIEEYIEGREFYVSIYGNRNLTVLPPLELDLQGLPPTAPRIATNKVKWDESYRQRYNIHTQIADNLSAAQLKDIINLAKKTYKALSMNGYCRLDLRMNEKGRFYVIEANPNPDIGEQEEFAQSARSAGMNYTKLLNTIVQLGLKHQPGRLY